MSSYDKEILAHYKNVAEKQSEDDSCTMDDQITRKLETLFIINTIKKEIKEKERNSKLRISDIGCGNGFTISKVAESYPEEEYSAFEYTKELKDIANKKKTIPCKVESCDVRKKNTLPQKCNIIICQRVLINLLDEKDQKKALENLIDSLESGGILISIEAFKSNLAKLNLCRNELGLSTIPPAHHNLYLSDDFFENLLLEKENTLEGENYLSTHYFITRVLHDIALKTTNSPFVRNSLFVDFFDKALPPGIGEFSPLKCIIFRKK